MHDVGTHFGTFLISKFTCTGNDIKSARWHRQILPAWPLNSVCLSVDARSANIAIIMFRQIFEVAARGVFTPSRARRAWPYS